MQHNEHYGAFFMGRKRIKKAFLFLKKGKNEKIADFTLQEDPFCTKSKILAKGGVARRAKPEVRRVRSFSEAQNSLKRNLKRSAKKRSSNKIQEN